MHLSNWKLTIGEPHIICKGVIVMNSLYTTRRQFLRATLGSTALVSLGLDVPTFVARSASAATRLSSGGSGKVLVVLQLSGGNDGLNTVIPFADPEYAKNRAVL